MAFSMIYDLRIITMVADLWDNLLPALCDATGYPAFLRNYNGENKNLLVTVMYPQTVVARTQEYPSISRCITFWNRSLGIIKQMARRSRSHHTADKQDFHDQHS